MSYHREPRRRDLLAWLGAAAAVPPAPRSEVVARLKAELDALAARWDPERTRSGCGAAVRRFVRERLVPAPRPSAPPRVRLVRTLERPGYRVENLMYEAAPDLWVTANLYLPEGRGPWPAVISPCGHYELSRMYPDYQRAYAGMVRAGFVVLAYDPPGQGERRHHLDPPMRSTEEHSLAGQLLELLGESLTAWMVRDGMRGIDYLLTRPEVDPQRLGCAGHSGGGTMTMYLACADERIGCVAIHEGGTFHRWPLKLNAAGQAPISDAEQNLFGAAAQGIDVCDLHAAIAPRPLLVTIEQYAPEFNRTADHIRAAYAALGVAGRFATAEAQARHAWTDKLRIANTDWFSRWFHGRPGPAAEPAMEVEKPETLFCTSSGSLRRDGVGRTLFAAIHDTEVQLRAQRPRRLTPDLVRKVLRVPALTRVAPTSSQAVLTFDESALLPAPGVFGQENAAAYLAWYMDRELFGMRVAEVLQAVEANGRGGVKLVGRGMGALWVLAAAAIDRRVTEVVCEGGLLSWATLTASDRYEHSASVMVRGVLRYFDLPDLARLVQSSGRKVTIVSAVDAMKQPV